MTKKFLEQASWFNFGTQTSKVHGRRNYQVSINRKEKTVTVGCQKAIKEAGLLAPFIDEIKELKLLWAAFTYKKDVINLLKDLEKHGYKIQWI